MTKINHCKKGDKVIILAGKDKGKTGTISSVNTKTGRVIVDGVNIIKRARKAKKQGEKGTIVEVAAPLHASNVKKID